MTFDFRLVKANDVPQLQALLRRCYGDTYYDSVYYRDAVLISALANDDQTSMVAVNADGEFVAHTALRNYRNSFTADTSMAIVDPGYRSRGLFVDLGAAMFPSYERL